MNDDPPKKSFTSAVLFMVTSATCLSFVGLLGKIGLSDLPLTSILFWRFFSAFLVCLVFIHYRGQIKKISHKKLTPHLIRAFFVLGSQYSFFYYANRESLLNATALLNTGPLFIPIIERVFLKKTIRKSTWVAIGVAFAGVLCILQPGIEILSPLIIVGILSGFSQGCSQVVFGINSKEERSDLNVLYLLFLCSFFTLFPYLLFSPEANKNPELSLTSFVIVLGLGTVTFCNQIFRAEAYQRSAPGKLAVFTYISVVLAGIWDALFFKTPPNYLAILGSSLVILGGGLKIYLRNKALKKYQG